MAKRRVTRLKGRTVVAMVLVAFVAVAAGVIWRRSYGYAQDRAMRDLESRRAQLLAERTRLQGDIRDLSSRAKLAPLAERRLRMRVPSDSQVVDLVRPLSSGGRADAASEARVQR